MPYEWSPPPKRENGSQWQLCLWPYRSLLKRHFVIFMGATAILIGLPLVALLGSGVMWGLFPFILLTFWGLWIALKVSFRRGEVLETLTVTKTAVHLARLQPDGQMQEWTEQRDQVTAQMHPHQGPVEHYITLRGNGREVELGSFLDPRERRELFGDLKRGLRI